MIMPREEETTQAPPFSIQAEMSVVGGMLASPEMIPVAVGVVQAEDFYGEAHRRLFRLIVGLWEQQAPIDTVTVGQRLIDAGSLDAVGGWPYMNELVESVPTGANIEYHAKIVRDKAARRRLIAAGTAIVQSVRDARDESADELQAEAERMLTAVTPKTAGEGLVWVKSLLPAELERLEKLQDEPDKPLGLYTGLTGVDEKLGPMEPGSFVVVAARPAMGKSSYAISNIAADVAIRQRRATAVFSVETPKAQVVTRLMGSEGRVNMTKAKRMRRIEDHEYPRISQASSFLNTAPLFIDHTPGLTVDQMRVKLRKLERERGEVGLVVVDYIQLMSHPKAKDLREEVTKVSQGLKRVAQEFACVVVALSQLSRGVESRPDKKPMMSDLKESGAIEQDADVIMLLYRPEYYFGPTMTVGRGKEAKEINVQGKASVILGKVRDGATGEVACRFEAEFTKFSDWSSS
jgi:replicative DNA helicase